MQDAALSADNLACRRGDRVLFARLSFALAAGQALQLVGANGVGKSSLIRLLAGLAVPFAGAVRRQGGVALVDERHGLDNAAPLGQALEFWARLDGAGCDRAGLEDLGLAGLLDVPVRYLSTGQKKRAAMARMLGQRAAIWLLDEPLNGLDSAAQSVVEAMTARHCAGGGIAVIASHQSFRLDGLARLDLADFVA